MATRIRKSTPSDTNIFLFFLDRTSHPPCCQFYLIAGLYHTVREMSYCILLIQVLMKQTLLPTPGFTPVWVSVWVSPNSLQENILKKFGKQGKTADFLRNQRLFGCGGRIWTDGLRVMSGCPGVYSCRASWKKPWNYNGLYKIAWCIVTAYYGIVGIISSHIVPAILYHLTSCLINTCTLCYS